MPKNREDEKLESSRVEVSLELLLKGAKKGYTIDELVGRLEPWPIADNLDKLLDAGANPDKLVSRLDSEEITDNLDKLLDAGANPDKLVSRLDSEDVIANLEDLLAAGAKINVDELVG